MMNLNVIALLFVSVAINHMGLIEAIEERTGLRLIVVDCVKCLAFWSCLTYNLIIRQPVILSLAMAFICSYAALWLEMLWGFVDRIYLKCYEKIVSNAGTGEITAGSNAGNSQKPVSDLRKKQAVRK